MNRRLEYRLLYQAARNAEGLSLKPRLERIMGKLSAAELQDLAGTLENWAVVIARADDLGKFTALKSRGIAALNSVQRADMAALLQRWSRQLRGLEPIDTKVNRLHSYRSASYKDLN